MMRENDSFYVGVRNGGEVISLEFIDKSGEAFEIAFKFEGAEKLSKVLAEAVEVARRVREIGEV